MEVNLLQGRQLDRESAAQVIVESDIWTLMVLRRRRRLKRQRNTRNEITGMTTVNAMNSRASHSKVGV